MRTIQLSVKRTVIYVTMAMAIPIACAFSIGWHLGASCQYDSMIKTIQYDLKRQIADAVKEGVPFYIKGIPIKFMPRADGNINVYMNEASILGGSAHGSVVR